MPRKNKKIIHSKEWINKNVEHTLWHPTDPPDVREWQCTSITFTKYQNAESML